MGMSVFCNIDDLFWFLHDTTLWSCANKDSKNASHLTFFLIGVDVSTTMILKPGPVINFILSNQYIENNDTRRIDWSKVSYRLDAADVSFQLYASPKQWIADCITFCLHVLLIINYCFRQSMHWRIWGSKPLTRTLNSKLLAWVRSLVLNRRETNIFLDLMFQQHCHLLELNNVSCSLPRFHLKQRNDSNSDTVEVTIYDYYMKRWGIQLKDSVNFPCLNVGMPKCPTYIPIEVSQYRS
jgi:hypothetical protein